MELDEIDEKACSDDAHCAAANIESNLDIRKDCEIYQCIEERCRRGPRDQDRDGAYDAMLCTGWLELHPEAARDCDDRNPQRSFDAKGERTFDGVDNDCDTRVDEGLFGAPRVADIGPASPPNDASPAHVTYAMSPKLQPLLVLSRGGSSSTWSIESSQLVAQTSASSRCTAERPCGRSVDRPELSVSFAATTRFAAGIDYGGCAAGRLALGVGEAGSTMHCGCRTDDCDCKCAPEVGLCGSDRVNDLQSCTVEPTSPRIATLERLHRGLAIWTNAPKAVSGIERCGDSTLMAAYRAATCEPVSPAPLGTTLPGVESAVASFEQDSGDSGFIVAHVGPSHRVSLCAVASEATPRCAAELTLMDTQAVERVALAVDAATSPLAVFVAMASADRLLFARVAYDAGSERFLEMQPAQLITQLTAETRLTGGPSVALLPDSGGQRGRAYVVWTDSQAARGVALVAQGEGALLSGRIFDLCQHEGERLECETPGWPILFAWSDSERGMRLIYGFTTQHATQIVWGDLIWPGAGGRA